MPMPATAAVDWREELERKRYEKIYAQKICSLQHCIYRNS